jgi:hypothetical protein
MARVFNDAGVAALSVTGGTHQNAREGALRQGPGIVGL